MKRNSCETFFEKRYTADRVKPLIDFHDEQLLERGPCKTCGVPSFMGKRNAEYCSRECQRVGHERSKNKSQARLKERRSRSKSRPPEPPQQDENLSFLERRVRQMEREGLL